MTERLIGSNKDIIEATKALNVRYLTLQQATGVCLPPEKIIRACEEMIGIRRLQLRFTRDWVQRRKPK